ncbi:hypothetical protein [Streptomyces murinus]
MTPQVVIGILIVVAALALRTAWAERRQAGSGLQQWKFLGNAKAVIAGLLVFGSFTAAVILSGEPGGAVLWAVLAGLLTALIVYQMTDGRPRS